MMGFDPPAPSGGRRRPTIKSADTRARIVKGALRALERHGIGETTTRRIAAEADIRLAALHYHFENKEAVLLAVLDALVAELAQALRDGPRRTPLDARIADLVHTAWAYMEGTRAKQVVQYELTLYALRTRGSDWLARHQYEAYVAAYAAQLGTDVEPSLDSEQARHLGRFLLAGMDGLILQHLVGTEPRALAPALAALVTSAQTYGQVLLHGCSASGG